MGQRLTKNIDLVKDLWFAPLTSEEAMSTEIYQALQRMHKKGEPGASEARRSLESLFRQVKRRQDLLAKAILEMKKRLIAKAAEDAVVYKAALQAPQEGIIDLTNSINQEPDSEYICTPTLPCWDQYCSPTSPGGSLTETWKGTSEEDDEDEKCSAAGSSAAGSSADRKPMSMSMSTARTQPPLGWNRRPQRCRKIAKV